MGEIAAVPITPACGRFKRHLLLALALAAAVVMVRGVLIIRAQSPCIDDNYHLYRGQLFLRGDFATLRQIRLNDPLLGAALSALPAFLHGATVPDPELVRRAGLMTAPPKDICYELPERIRYETALWKGLLFLPLVAVVFAWIWQLYGQLAAWLGMILLLTEPTIAAHLPLPTVDVLGMEGAVIGAWAAWRLVQRPTLSRGAAAALAIAVAVLLKHTAILLPLVLVMYAAIYWLAKERLLDWRLLRRAGALAAVLALIPLLMWALMRFEVGRVYNPPGQPTFPGDAFFSRHALPIGTYVASVAQASSHANWGHRGYLLGQVRREGWWYYFPVVAAFKVPLGIGLVFLAAGVSLIFRRPRFDEVALLIAAAVWAVCLSLQRIDIGFRHFLPPYVFLLMLSCRCASGAGRAIAAAAWAGAVAAAVHSTLWIPNQLSYINFLRKAAYLSISDSNVDWGQGLKQIHQWIDHRPDDGRPIYVGYFGPSTTNLYENLGPRLTGYSNMVRWLPSPSGQVVQGTMPDKGILLLSPVLLTGQYGPPDRFIRLRKVHPRQIIGDCILVYDLDELSAK